MSGLGIRGSGARVSGLGVRVSGARVSGLGIRDQGFGFRGILSHDECAWLNYGDASSEKPFFTSALAPIPKTLSATPQTKYKQKSWNINTPQPWIVELNPKPKTLNPKPKTLSPKS